MRRLVALLIGGMWLAASASQAATAPHPRLVKVNLDSRVTLEKVQRSGLDVIAVRPGSHVMILEWPGDASRLDAIGAHATVIDENPGRTAALISRAELRSRPPMRGSKVLTATGPDGVFRTAVLPPFGAGSMGGFWTLAEVKMKLDQLVADDAHDIVSDKVDTLGWSYSPSAAYPPLPIWGLKLGRAVVGPDTRPAMSVHGLTHAREPAGMETALHFADDLISRYGTDPTATYLLDHRQIYIVPVTNPGGYKLNEDFWTTNDSVLFGYQRKNVRDTNGNGVLEISVDGVDLNRNYSYQWGLDDIGSSGDPTVGNYRGTAPFSEPETQAIRGLLVGLRPQTVLDFHSHSDMFMFPWSYTTQGAPDSAAFKEWTDDMTLGNGYQSGQGTRILYETNGEFTDWCYGETGLKPRIMAWTAELGGPTDLFWPPPSRILSIADEGLRFCYYMASIAGPYVRVETARVVEGNLNAGSLAHLEIGARNKGQSEQAGPGLVATLSSLSAGANVAIGTASLPTLGPLQSAGPSDLATFVVSADDTVTPGRLLRFRVDFTAPDGFFSRDTVEVLCGTPTLLFADGASSGVGNWTGRWTVASDPSHPSAYFVDSPGIYKSKTDSPFTLATPLDLSHGLHAYLLFEGRWEFETDYDCGLAEASLDGVHWTPLPASGTSLGVGGGVQPVGQPVFDGTRLRWRADRLDLSPFVGPAGTAVRLRWRVISDQGGQFDGFSLDSMRVVAFDPATQPTPVAVGAPAPAPGLWLASPLPNPARAGIRVDFGLPRQTEMHLDVFDLGGRRVRRLASSTLPPGRYEHGWDLRDDSGRLVPAGVYLLALSAASERRTRRLVVMP
jgi:hypothetical protein